MLNISLIALTFLLFRAEFARQKKPPTSWVDIGFIMKMQAAKPQTGGVILKTLESLPADDDKVSVHTSSLGVF